MKRNSKGWMQDEKRERTGEDNSIKKRGGGVSVKAGVGGKKEDRRKKK